MTASRPLERGADAAAWLAAARCAVGRDVGGLVVRAVGALAAGAAMTCGSVLAVRRLTGAIGPAAPALLLGVTAAGAVLVVLADAGRRAGGKGIGPAAARLGLVVAVAALVVPLRVAGPGDWLMLVGACLVAAAAVAGPGIASWSAFERSTRGGVHGEGGGQPPRRGATAWIQDLLDPRRSGGGLPVVSRQRAAHRRRNRGARGRETVWAGAQPGMVRQRFERRELPTGAERVRGRVVVTVPAASKAGYGHLGFCPAFVATPTVEVATAYDGVEVTVTAAEVLPWGVRVECRLAEPAEEPVDIPVDIVASVAVSPAASGRGPG